MSFFQMQVKMTLSAQNHILHMALYTTNVSPVNISFDQMSFEHMPIDQMRLQKRLLEQIS